VLDDPHLVARVGAAPAAASATATSQSWRVTSDSRIASRSASGAARVIPKNGIW
jgi:hypothetical protein